jgi:Tol biopolymer transport system component
MSVAVPNDVRTGGDMRARSLRPRLAGAIGALLVAGLFCVPGGERADATSPGSNGRIYFQQSDSIFALSPSGVVKKVVPSTKFSGLVEAIPSPDGGKLAFTSTRGGSDLWTRDLTTGDYKNVTGKASDQLTLTSIEFPTWSPDGRQLIFQATRQQRSRLYRINADGTGIKELMYFEDVVAGDLSPDWSSTGKVVFSYDGDLFTMAPTPGATVTKVTIDRGEYDAGFMTPSWSPDGTRIAAEYDGDSFADGGVIIVTPNPGPGQARYNYLTGDEDNQHSEVIEDPAWSPDGKWIVYYGHWAPGSGDFEDYDLWKVKVASPGTPVDLDARSPFGADTYHPSWSVKPQ